MYVHAQYLLIIVHNPRVVDDFFFPFGNLVLGRKGRDFFNVTMTTPSRPPATPPQRERTNNTFFFKNYR